MKSIELSQIKPLKHSAQRTMYTKDQTGLRNRDRIIFSHYVNFIISVTKT